MFTITTGHWTHYIQAKQSIDLGHGLAGFPIVLVMVDPVGPDRYKFVPSLFFSETEWELITEEQLDERRRLFTAEVIDPKLGKTLAVVEWSLPCRDAFTVCQVAIQEFKKLLAGGIFDLPETF